MIEPVSAAYYHPSVRVQFETPPTHSHFLGYYNHNPLTPDRSSVLCHRVEIDGRDLQAGDVAEVGAYSLVDGTWTTFGKTTAFSWQEGAMLQWLPSDPGRAAVFNVIADGKAVGCILRIGDAKPAYLQRPIYTVHPRKSFALGLNVGRLSTFRPSYGYGESHEARQEGLALKPREDGVFRVDLDTGEASVLVSIDAIAEKFTELRDIASQRYYIQHCWWNPSGTRFIFYLRVLEGSGEFKTHLLCADEDGGKLFLFPECAMYSHLAWRSDDDFTIWSSQPTAALVAYQRIRRGHSKLVRYVARALRTILLPRNRAPAISHHTRAGYYTMRCHSREKTAFARDLLQHDGHPSWCLEGHVLCADTYEDEASCREVFMYDAIAHRRLTLARFYSPFNRCGYRCDLHPRVTADGKSIVIDSAHTGRRQLYVLAVDQNDDLFSHSREPQA